MAEPVTRPGYDRELEEALVVLPPFPLLNDHTIQELRAASPDPAGFGKALRDAGVVREDLRIEGPGGDLELMVLRPADVTGTLPALLMLHGGGMVLSDRTGNIRELDVLGWIRRLGLVVISPEYRRAPEAPAPAGIEDCYAALEWVAANARSRKVDAKRIVLAGVSGGGGLAAGTALLARDRGGPAPVAQLLICPMLDDRNRTVSARQYAAAEGPFAGWPTENNVWAWQAVLGERHAEREDIGHYAAPGRAADLSGLPPTYLDAGSAEVFRDEVVQYASRLWACGTQAELHIWAGGFHGFDLFAPRAAVSVAARAAREGWLNRVLGPPTTG